MISCSSGCKHQSTSVSFSSWISCTWSVTSWRRSVIFCRTLANSWRESGWLVFSCSSREWRTVSCRSSMGLTFSRPGRSARGESEKTVNTSEFIIIHQTHIYLWIWLLYIKLIFTYGFDYYTSNSYFLWIWFQTAAHYYTSNSYYLWISLLYIKLIFTYGFHYYTSNSYFLWIWLLYIKLIFPMDLISDSAHYYTSNSYTYGFHYYTSNSYPYGFDSDSGSLLYIKLIFPMDFIIIHQTHIPMDLIIYIKTQYLPMDLISDSGSLLYT